MTHCQPVSDTRYGHDVCLLHGSLWPTDGPPCLTWQVLDDVSRHRVEQYQTHGANRDLLYGTGPTVPWLHAVIEEVTNGVMKHSPYPRADVIERIFRDEWDFDRDPDQPYTWMQMVREEVAEAFAEDDPDDLEVELTQIAALCVSWIEKIRERRELGQ